MKDEAFDEFTRAKNKWVEGWNAGVPSRFGYAESFAEWSVRDVEDMVRRDRHHPSIVMWSLGNEVDYPNDPFSHPVLGQRYRPANPPADDLVSLARPSGHDDPGRGPHSVRSASTGSARVARIAGISAAERPTTATTVAAAP